MSRAKRTAQSGKSGISLAADLQLRGDRGSAPGQRQSCRRFAIYFMRNVGIIFPIVVRSEHFDTNRSEPECPKRLKAFSRRPLSRYSDRSYD
jgi:hypothetical protein